MCWDSIVTKRKIWALCEERMPSVNIKSTMKLFCTGNCMIVVQKRVTTMFLRDDECYGSSREPEW